MQESCSQGSSPRLVSVGSWAAPRGKDAPPHRHPTWKITYYRTGQISTSVDGVLHTARAGTVLIVPPAAAHAEIALTAYANFYALVETRDSGQWPTMFAGTRARRVGELLAALLQEHTQPDMDSPGCTGAILTLLDATLRREHAGEGQTPALDLVLRAESIMRRRYNQGLKMTLLAAELNCSTSTLRRAFLRSGRPAPHVVLRDMRRECALDLLATSDLPLTSVAERCGYHSASHLSRDVKQRTGRTPGSQRNITR